MSGAWGQLREALLAHAPTGHIASAHTSLRAQRKARWERWIHEKVRSASWGSESDVGEAIWGEDGEPQRAVGAELESHLKEEARKGLGAESEREIGEIGEAIERARDAIEGIAEQATAAHYDAEDVTRGGARATAMIERERANGGEWSWPEPICITTLARLGACPADALAKLKEQPVWLRVWALEAAGITADERWLERGPEHWMRGRAGYEAGRRRVAKPKEGERVGEMIEGWPGRYEMPPFGAGMALFRRRGKALGEDEWGAASLLESRMGGNRDEEALARATEKKAQQMQAEIEEFVREGAVKIHGREGLDAAKEAWANEPALRGTPARAALKEKPERHYTMMPGDRRRVGWVVPYDSAERLLCAAATNRRSPSEEMRRNRAMHLTGTMDRDLEMYGAWPREESEGSTTLRRAVEAVERVERTMAT